MDEVLITKRYNAAQNANEIREIFQQNLKDIRLAYTQISPISLIKSRKIEYIFLLAYNKQEFQKALERFKIEMKDPIHKQLLERPSFYKKIEETEI